MKLTINGVAIEATKEDLEKALKEFDKPVGTIKFRDGNNEYGLYKNGKAEIDIGNTELPFQENYSQLIYKIADAMEVLATKEEMLNEEIVKCYIYYDNNTNKFQIEKLYASIYSVAIKQNFDKVIADLLNNSPLMKEFK